MKIKCAYCFFGYEIDIIPDIGQPFECSICGKKFIYGITPTHKSISSDLILQYNYPLLLKKSINELRGISTAIIYDSNVDDSEINLLLDWIKRNEDFKNEWPIRDLIILLADILKDGIVDDIERKKMFLYLSGISTGNNNTPDSIFDISPEILFPNRKFIVTGELEWGSRDIAESKILSKGGNITKSVVKNLDYLIVGSLGNEAWKYGNYGSKIEKAKEWRSRGQNNPLIVSENDFIRAIIE